MTDVKQNPLDDWVRPGSEVTRYVEDRVDQCLAAYRANPLLVDEHANIERATAQGGYGRRQLYELVQNGADALIGHPGGRVHVVLTPTALYCANQGMPVTLRGVDALMSSHLSVKRGTEIGRFGLGFKSVLGVSSCPEFYSRSGSFRFDAVDAARRIREVVPNAERLPQLRLAAPADPISAASGDECLAELMSWASTVVKLPLDRGGIEWLVEDIRDFPACFLLFCPHVGYLVLEDRTASTRREIRVRTQGGSVCLEEQGMAEALWKVFHANHIPSDQAREDAGELADRAELPIMWAVQTSGRMQRGRFWAFFPTEYYTTLSGILNAPWKTNEDRQNLLSGAFNKELIGAAAGLIARSLAELTEPDDPGRYLDLMPARGREAPNWADDYLTEQVYAAAAHHLSVPDQTGAMRLPTEINLHPPGLPKEALDSWRESPCRPDNWCHHACDTRDRRPRVDRLFQQRHRSAASVQVWLEALVRDPTPHASVSAMLTAAHVIHGAQIPRQDVEAAHIVLTTSGELVRPLSEAVFTAEQHHDRSASFSIVEPSVAATPEGRQAIDLLGIRAVDATSEVRALLAKAHIREMVSDQCVSLWRLLGRLSPEQAFEVVGEATEGQTDAIPVRTKDGSFRPLREALLPGKIVPADGTRDASVAVDVAYHWDHLAILRKLGAVEAPSQDRERLTAPWADDYMSEVYHDYLAGLPKNTRSRPSKSYMVLDRETTFGPLEPFERLSGEGRAAFTLQLAKLADGDDEWTLAHQTRRDQYPPVPVTAPAIWFAKTRGLLNTSCAVRPVKSCVSESLARWSAFLPVARCGKREAELLGLPDELASLDVFHWVNALAQAHSHTDAVELGAFYAAACLHIDEPQLLCCRVGDSFEQRRPAEIVSASDAAPIDILAASMVPFVVVRTEEGRTNLVERWHLRSERDSLFVEASHVESGPDVPLIDRLVGLLPYLRSEHASLRAVPCSSLAQQVDAPTGRQVHDCRALRQEGVVFYLDTLDERELVHEVARVLGINLDRDAIEHVREHSAAQEASKRALEVRQAPGLAVKLHLAVGKDAIRRRLPSAVLALLDGRPEDASADHLAALALSVYGVETLIAFRDDLDRMGLCPPAEWSGSTRARAFVHDLGFPEEYAGFKRVRREAAMEISGPPRLAPLHGFQAQIVGRIHDLLGRTEQRRALLSLPTGAGKTRVVVQALVESLAKGRSVSPVLWIAQSDELCEQAVQSWSEVWRDMGTPDSLHVNRLWASNEADEHGDGRQVVVATIQKLQGCVGKAAYEWLSEAGCVVVDEAHHATEPSYTAVLEWLGLRRDRDRCPLIGLTATPFRGVHDETQRLVYRFRHRLDEGVLGEDPYGELQMSGVLARVDHEVLDGVEVELTADELVQFEAPMLKSRSLPQSAERRLGENTERNLALLDSICRRPPDWPILLFATSVEHAKTMAALLQAKGIASAAVSGDTDEGARRHYIEQFRQGRIRVLANYQVLTTGFDAPAVRAVYVSRPVFSPVLYQQMIGRGLRGPLNRGKERCLIVNVQDNFDQFGETLAFHDFEHLWRRGGAISAAASADE